MALRIAGSEMPLTVWARRPASLEPFVGVASIARSLKDLARNSDVVGVCVTSDADVRQVVLGNDGVLAGLRPGSILCLHSTIHPDTCIEIGDAARAKDADVLDAPVSGGSEGAELGSLTVAVGGREQAFLAASPVLKTFGGVVRWVGPLGAGLRLKILNNALMLANMAVAFEALDAGLSLAIVPEMLHELLPQMSGGSRGLEYAIGLRAQVPREDVMAVLDKDAGHFRSLVHDASLQVPTIEPALRRALERLRSQS